MYTETEGIILRQTKTVNGRRMILLFSKKFGKISAGTNITEKGRSKAALAMRPFAYGRYEMFKNQDRFNIQSAEMIKSYFKIGEDVEKFMGSSYVLELSDKLLQEGSPNPRYFQLMLDFFEVMEKREIDVNTLILAFQVKVLQIFGVEPQLDTCVLCNKEETVYLFGIEQGGLICENCMKNVSIKPNDSLIYELSFDIVDILKYFLNNPLQSFQKLVLDEEKQIVVKSLLRKYLAYHLDLGILKSESYI
jgi:DNA repair protein RecO (recombination protein O)